MMILKILGTILLAAVSHTGYVHREDKPLFWPVVTVRNCDGSPVDTYVDAKLTIPMRSPFLANADGTYKYYANTPYVVETILFGSETITKSTCLEEEK